MSDALRTIRLDHLREHPDNPRKHFDAAALEDLAASIRAKGILEPLLARPSGKAYQILAGSRRLRAAKIAGLAEVPAIVRQIDDTSALEVMIVDNLQRADVHPMDEAAGYHSLVEAGYDVARIAERVGKSVKYVYDRMKLTSLVKEARELFYADRITAGHAILLARLKPEDQRRAIGIGDKYDRPEEVGGLFQRERTLFDHNEEPLSGKGEERREKERGPYHGLKARSVRELQAWIDANVKLEAADVDQMILPETAAALEVAAQDSVKVLRLTHKIVTPEPVCDGPKIILGRSWARADGKAGSKTCGHSQLGHLVIGPGRGEAFQACVAKEKCAVHWGDRIRARKKQAAAARKAVKAGADPEEARERARKAEQARQEKEREAFERAHPEILKQFAAGVKKANVHAETHLGHVVLEAFGEMFDRSAHEARKSVPAGKTPENLVRHLAMAVLLEDLDNGWEAWNRDTLVKHGRALGVDVKRIVEAAAKPKVQTSGKPAGRKGARRGETAVRA